MERFDIDYTARNTWRDIVAHEITAILLEPGETLMLNVESVDDPAGESPVPFFHVVGRDHRLNYDFFMAAVQFKPRGFNNVLDPVSRQTPGNPRAIEPRDWIARSSRYHGPWYLWVPGHWHGLHHMIRRGHGLHV